MRRSGELSTSHRKKDDGHGFGEIAMCSHSAEKHLISSVKELKLRLRAAEPNQYGEGHLNNGEKAYEQERNGN